MAGVAGYCGLPQLEGLGGAILVAGHAVVVLIGDEQALALADAVSQIVRLARELLALSPLAEAAVHRRERGVGGREGVIEFGGLVEKRDRFQLAAPAPFLEAQRVGLQRRQRRRRRLLDGTSNRSSVGSDSPSVVRIDDEMVPENRQHALVARRLCLGARQRLARQALGRVQREDVVRAQRRDRSLRASRGRPSARRPRAPMAEVSGSLGRTAHVPQRLADAGVGHDIEKRRLAELYLERRDERLVEHRRRPSCSRTP
jgi:hypothetical protein